MIRRLSVLALIAILAVLGACSDDEPSIAAYCLRLDELVRADVALNDIDPTDPDASAQGLRTFSAAVAAAGDQAPDELDEDLDTIGVWVDAVIAAYQTVSDDPLTDAVRFDEATADLTDPTDALARVRAHARSECGFDLNEAP